jgi:hypothetical protein
MSFTSLEIVRKHILEKHLGVNRVVSESLCFRTEDPIRVVFPPIQEGSEIVKSITRHRPEFQVAAFGSSNEISLSGKPVVKDTVVVAGDSSLGLIYQENIDYLVDYANGVISRIASGAIDTGRGLAIWYLPYRTYAKDIDYWIDYAKGELVRLSDGSIYPGQALEIDYISKFGIIDDDIIANAINEANESVLNYIDSAYIDSSDRSLVIGETYLAIAIICRIKALESVSAGMADNAKSSWLAIADQYRNEAFAYLEKFAAAVGSLTVPKRV